jgi:hypothetical protein
MSPAPIVPSVLAPSQETIYSSIPDPFHHNDLISEPPLSEEEWQMLRSFHKELYKDIMEECDMCKEKWFNMGIREGICGKCRRRDKKKADDEPALFSKENFMDPGTVPEHLPKLTNVEEQLIARVHVHIEVRQICGQQYKYTGHIVNFLRNVGKVYKKLPLLSRDLDIVLLRPSGSSIDPRLQRQFERNFRVRRRAIRDWLEWLRRNHSGYRDIEVDNDVLSELPEDGTIIDSIKIVDIEPTEPNTEVGAEIDADTNDEELFPTVATVPNLRPEHQELEQLRQQVEEPRNPPPSAIIQLEPEPEPEPDFPYLTMPSFRSTPL